MIVNRERSNVIQQEAMKHGMRTLWQDGLKKVEDGITSLSELERVTDDTSGKDDVKKITNKNKSNIADVDNVNKTANSSTINNDSDDEIENTNVTHKEDINNDTSDNDKKSAETSPEPTTDDVPVKKTENSVESVGETTDNDTTIVSDVHNNARIIDETITAIPDVEVTPSDNVVEIATEEPLTIKKTNGGFLQNLQRGLGGLFKPGDTTEGETSSLPVKNEVTNDVTDNNTDNGEKPGS